MARVVASNVSGGKPESTCVNRTLGCGAFEPWLPHVGTWTCLPTLFCSCWRIRTELLITNPIAFVWLFVSSHDVTFREGRSAYAVKTEAFSSFSTSPRVDQRQGPKQCTSRSVSQKVSGLYYDYVVGINGKGNVGTCAFFCFSHLDRKSVV